MKNSKTDSFSLMGYSASVLILSITFQVLTAHPHSVDSVSIERSVEETTAFSNAADSNKLVKETCMTNGIAYINHFPNVDNCSTFWTCYLISAGMPQAREEVCNDYKDNSGTVRLLNWNFMECRCDYPGNSQCYNPWNDTHYFNRYKCAQKVQNELHLGGSENGESDPEPDAFFSLL